MASAGTEELKGFAADPATDNRAALRRVGHLVVPGPAGALAGRPPDRLLGAYFQIVSIGFAEAASPR
jgi:ABC-type branched-subunit amino acid transport system permease subunit